MPDSTCKQWLPIAGELYTFDEPVTRLSLIDRVGNFHPGESLLYTVSCKCSVPVGTDDGILPAWLYVEGERAASRIAPFPRTVWP